MLSKWKLRGCTIACSTLLVTAADAQIRVNPTGVNVNMNGATTVFLTFGGLGGYQPVEAIWCGELVSAAPDLGLKCDPSTIFGRLPIRLDQSRTSGVGGFTDIMSIPPSVARRAYQAAEQGRRSTFFYVRRFRNPAGGQEQYVAVTCRLTGGGARVPFSLTDVEVKFDVETPILFLQPGEQSHPLSARISYNGTGRLKGRWEVVHPGDQLPEERDLLTEASLPVEERSTQRQYTELSRFNVFLPPTGQYVLQGPDVSRIPTTIEGAYLILLRIEASDDKEGDSDLGAAGAGAGIVHSGAVAGFPLPPLRYVVGAGNSDLAETVRSSQLRPLTPIADVAVADNVPLQFTWVDASARAAFARIEIRSDADQEIVSAIVPRGTGTYRAPTFLRERSGGAALKWRVTSLDLLGREISSTDWRSFTFAAPPAQ